MIVFSKSGNLNLETNFKDGKENGVRSYYSADGSLQKQEVYKDDKLVK